MANEVIRIDKVTALPSTRTANTIYLVKDPTSNRLTIQVTGVTPDVIAKTIDSIDIASQIDTALSGLSLISFAEDIPQMMALTPSANTLVYVYDASGDPNAGVGPAAYVYNVVNETFLLIPKGGSSGGSIDWNTIVGRPSSSAQDIDLSVGMRHTHSNESVLDQFGESNGEPTYNGEPFSRNVQVISDW